jgi:hypothetical protein
MKTQWSLIIIGCLAGTLLSGQNQNLNQVPNLNPTKQALEEAAKSPIDFWGKVVDQSGNPIAGATATFSLSRSLFSEEDDNTKIVVISDAGGLFSLTGKTGLGVSVSVSKDGYYSISGKSNASLNYFLKLKHPGISFNRAGTNESFPTEQKPTVFILTKKGEPAANLVHKFIRVPIPKDGSPVEINLVQGHVTTAGQGDLKIQSWVTDNGKDVVHPYGWKCLVTVPGGGLQLRIGKLDFRAPSSGYQSTDEVEMSNGGDHWSRDMNKQYFLQISGNRYARMRFEMVSGGPNILNLEYFLNPTPGNTNLESIKWSAAE